MSVSASAENLSSDNQSSGDGGNMCLELALEGERLCKAGDCRAGVAFFEAAIQAGTDDLRTLSAIYSQLGNAFFYLGDYVKAMQYHKHDLTLARTMGDKLGEAKSSGNLGNTLKVMGKYDEAMICCKRHLEISRELGDKLSEGRALYNLGNVYHAKGKHIGRVGQQDPGEFPEDVRSCLQQAVHYYEENLQLMRELNETAAQGRACGNLGNTYYLLGDFQKAIYYHEERLKIAREFGDKAAERRANSNLGNSHIFLGEFEAAAEHYKRTLVLAQELGDRAVEAQACYSLGNTYTLLRDYPTAIEYHLRHLIIAQQLMDRVGEGRACWSLGNAHSAMGNHEKALYFATKHLEISKELGDPMGQATAQMNVSDLRKMLGLPADAEVATPDVEVMCSAANTASGPGDRSSPSTLHHRLTPDGKHPSNGAVNKIQVAAAGEPQASKTLPSGSVAEENQGKHPDDEESFFDLLSRFQSKRMDDQRCSLNIVENKENNHSAAAATVRNNNNNNNAVPMNATEKIGILSSASNNKAAPLNNSNAASNKGLNFSNTPAEGSRVQDDLLDLIAGMQSKRMDEQRVALPHLPGLHPPAQGQVLQRLSVGQISEAPTMPDDTFLEMLMRCQGSRLEDQRSSLPVDAEPEPSDPHHMVRGPTVPDEDFFDLLSSIVRLQSDLALLRGFVGSSAASDFRWRCSSIGQLEPRAIRARSRGFCAWRTDLATVPLRGARGVFCFGLVVLPLTFDGNTMWDGFSEADIERLKSGECPTKALTAGSGPVVAARRQATHLRGSARKNSARERLLRPGAGGNGDADGGAVDIPDGARLSVPKVVESKNQDNSRLTPKNEDENAQLISKPDSKNNECETTLTKEKTLNVETSTNQGPVCIKIKEGKNYEVLSSEKTPLDEFQSRHKMMEEQNRRRKELLAKALADRKKKTHAEARRLQQIQEELQKLDALLSNDVGILRNQIEAASLEFMDAQKRYDKAEKEFLEAKLHLFGKLERKELLTEHLCKIIEQNEMRKAKKLSELMDKLELENPVEYTEEEQKNTVGSVIIPTLCALDEVSYSACNTLKSRQSDPKHSLKTSSEELEKNLSSNSVQSSSVAPTKDSADAVEDSNSTAMNKVLAVDTTTCAPVEIGDKLAKESV